MDNLKGEFESISEKIFEEQMVKTEPLVFKEGEIIEIRGSRFRVEKIYKRRMSLKLLSQLKNKNTDTNN